MLNRVMNCIYEWVAIVFWVVGTPWYLWLIACDLMHPELWDDDPLHDPRKYLPVMGLVILFMIWCVRDEEKTRKETQRLKAQAAKIAEFVATVKQQRAQGKWNEANDTVRRYEEWRRQQGLPELNRS